MSDEDLISQAMTQMDGAGEMDISTAQDDDIETAATTPAPAPVDAAAEPEAPVEENPAPAAEPEDTNPRLSKALARAAKREARALELETQLKAREETVRARTAEIERVSARWAELQDMARRDPLRLLSEAGVDMDALTRQLIHGDPPAKKGDPELEAMKREVAELRAANAKRQEDADGYRQRSLQLAAERYRGELESMVRAGIADAPFVSALDPSVAGAELQRITEQHWLQTKNDTGRGIVLDRTEAVRRLEGRLRSQYEILSKAARPATAAPPHKSGDKAPTTLTQSQRSRTAKTPAQLTDEERIQAALAEWGEQE